MSDETGINGGADLETPEAVLGPEEAAAIMREQDERARRRRIHLLALVVGLVAMYTLEGALYRGGAGRPVLFVFEATAPILVAGLFYLTTSALWLDWPLAGFGLWLAATAVGAAFAGPHGVWGVDALTAGLGFLFMAALEPRLRRIAGLGLHQP